MDLNNLRLPASLVVELYGSALIDPGEKNTKSPPITKTKEGPEVNPAPGWKSLGNNRKNILIIVRYPDAVHLPDKELGFITGMLGACKLDLDDVVIVNMENHPGTGFKELSPVFHPRIVFLFDISPAGFGLPMNFPHFQLQAYANNTFLYAPELKILEEDKILKSKLWVCLRRLFNI